MRFTRGAASLLFSAPRPPLRRVCAYAASSSATPFPEVPSIILNDGSSHPLLGFGTYKVGFIPASASAAAAGEEGAGAQPGVTARACVAEALEVGYRFLDCAEFYGNEAEVGHALQAAGVPRAELYLASKVWTTTIYNGPAAVKAQVAKTIQDLGCEYLDLCCVHWPVPGKHADAYVALQELQAEGKIRSLGLSNYAVEDYQELMADSRVAVPPAVNQIEVNPFLHRPDTLAFFQERGVAVQAYRALRDGKAFEHPAVLAVAQKHGRTSAQVLGRWCVEKGCVYIPKSVQKARMQENAQVFDFALGAEDVAALDALTTAANLDAFLELYRKCVNRDTPFAGTFEGVKAAITVG